MEIIQPKVFLIAQTEIDSVHEMGWLASLGIKGLNEGEKDIRYGMSEKGSERLVELAARRCYKSFAPGLNPNITKIRTDSKGYLYNILKSGHGSVLEHASATFAFEDVSRVFTHELVRHRAGTAFSQESLRYVRLDELKFWMPPTISEDDSTFDMFCDFIVTCEVAQQELAANYNFDKMDFNDKKRLTSAFRRLAPMGLATGIVATFNMRALRHVLEMRTSPAAEVEIREVFTEVGHICMKEWPLIFQDFKLVDGSWVPEFSKV